MIAKRYRLTFREVKKVLAHGKPFFSSSATALALPGKAHGHRCAIVVSGKHAKGSVIRNFFRRKFYDLALPHVVAGVSRPVDCVLLLKRGTVLDHRKPESVAQFVRDASGALAKALPKTGPAPAAKPPVPSPKPVA